MINLTHWNFSFGLADAICMSKVIWNLCIIRPFHRTYGHWWREKHPIYIPVYLWNSYQRQQRNMSQRYSVPMFNSLGFTLLVQLDKIKICDRQTTREVKIIWARYWKLEFLNWVAEFHDGSHFLRVVVIWFQVCEAVAANSQALFTYQFKAGGGGGRVWGGVGIWHFSKIFRQISCPRANHYRKAL